MQSSRLVVLMLVVVAWMLMSPHSVEPFGRAAASPLESPRRRASDTKTPGRSGSLRAESQRALDLAIEGANRCEAALRLQAAERQRLEALSHEAQQLRTRLDASARGASSPDNGHEATVPPHSEYANPVLDWLRGTKTPRPGTPSTPSSTSRQAIDDKLRTEGVEIDVDEDPIRQRFQSLSHLNRYIAEEKKRLDRLDREQREDLAHYQEAIEYRREQQRIMDVLAEDPFDLHGDTASDAVPSDAEEEPTPTEQVRQSVLDTPMLLGPTLGEKLDECRRDLIEAMASLEECRESVDRYADALAADADTRRQIERLRRDGPSANGDTPLEFALQGWESLDDFQANFEAHAQSRRDAERRLRDDLDRLQDEVASREADAVLIEATIEAMTDMMADQRIRELEDESGVADLMDGLRYQLDSSGASGADGSDLSRLLEALDADQMTPEEYAQRIMQRDFRSLKDMLDSETRQQASAINRGLTQRQRDYQIAVQRHQQRIRDQQNRWNQMNQWNSGQSTTHHLTPEQIQTFQQLGFPLDDAIVDAMSIFGGGD